MKHPGIGQRVKHVASGAIGIVAYMDCNEKTMSIVFDVNAPTTGYDMTGAWADFERVPWRLTREQFKSLLPCVVSNLTREVTQSWDMSYGDHDPKLGALLERINVANREALEYLESKTEKNR